MSALTTSEFINRAKIIHDDKYDYSLSNYINNKTKITIICNKHGQFYQLPNNHLIGRSCNACNLEKKTFTTQKFINKALVIYGNFYDYSLVNYINNHTKIKIKCSIHGIFEQIPVDHYKHGCNQCAIEYRARNMSSCTDEFINKSKIIHNNLYDYSLVTFKNAKTKVKIICKKHGIFLQKPEYHLIGCGCAICAKAGTSKKEKDWLDSLQISLENRQVTIKIENKFIRVDGYNSTTNTIYEYYGDFWHGNPLIYNFNDKNEATNRTFGELYQKTIEREELIKSANYNLITKWETE